MKNIILIAPPAAGKGTLSKLLSDNYGYTSISTGELLRKKAKSDNSLRSKMNEGKLISDEMVFSILKEEITSLQDKPYILDGFPRTVEQSKMYEELVNDMNKDTFVVIYLNPPKDELVKRITTRIICPLCERSYSMVHEKLMPKQKNLCDKCNVELVKREDDTEESFNNRYNEYLQKTSPLVEHYKNENVLYTISSLNVDDVYEEACKLI